MAQSIELAPDTALQRQLHRLAAWRLITMTWVQVSTLAAFVAALAWRNPWQPVCFIGVICYALLGAVAFSRLEKRIARVQRQIDHVIL